MLYIYGVSRHLTRKREHGIADLFQQRSGSLRGRLSLQVIFKVHPSEAQPIDEDPVRRLPSTAIRALSLHQPRSGMPYINSGKAAS